MSHEWPIGPAQLTPAPDQPLLPLDFNEHVELIRSSAAIAAFARKRAVQILQHGHTPEADLEKSLAFLAREAKARLHAFCDVVPIGRMNLPAHERERCLRYIEISAAILIALWERCQVEVPDE